MIRQMQCIAFAAFASMLATLATPIGASAQAKIEIPKVFADNCARCHNINGLNTVCPDLSDVGLRREAAYLRQSILDPNAYIVPGFPADVMPQNFPQILTSADVDTLVNFLLSLRGQTRDPNISAHGKGS